MSGHGFQVHGAHDDEPADARGDFVLSLLVVRGVVNALAAYAQLSR